MKVGSLVVVEGIPDRARSILGVSWLPVSDGETIYTIRGIYEDRAAYLEEGIVGYNLLDGTEISIDFMYLREVQPPMTVTIESLLEEEITI